MKKRPKILLLIGLTVICVGVTLFIHPVSQDPAYHQFADQRTIFGINNFWNVISNVPFIIIGFMGLMKIKQCNAVGSIKRMYAITFLGIILTSFGSGYYHYQPDNDSLIWDRIPMAIVFMAFFAAIVGELISRQFASMVIWPLLIIGIGSVLWWQYTEASGHGDLRLYGFVQFYPVIFIPLIMLLFPAAGTGRAFKALGWIVGWYLLAKIFEHYDRGIYSASGFISGHTLKHFAAAAATWWIVRLFQIKHCLQIQKQAAN